MLPFGDAASGLIGAARALLSYPLCRTVEARADDAVRPHFSPRDYLG